MSTPSKDFIAKWAPLILSILANIAIAGYAFGKGETRLVVIEAQLESLTRDKLVAYLVTRNEWVQKNAADVVQAQQNREDHLAIMAKLDRLLERQTGRTD